jgi:hypothetical protein
MRAASTIDPLLGPARYVPPLRLAFGRVLLRVFLVVFVITELQVWRLLRAIARGWPRGQRVVGLIFYTPASLFFAFSAAAGVAVAADLVVRWIVRPLLGRWYDPRPVDASVGNAGVFLLGASESIGEELPARLIEGRTRPAGTLALTNERIWFFPHSWDLAPRSIGWPDVAAVHIERPIIAAWGAIRGWPDELIVRPSSGQTLRLALAEPTRFLDWIEDSDLPRYLHHD